MTTQREETNNLKDEYQVGYRGRAHDVRDRYIEQLQSTLAEREEANAALEAEVMRLRNALETFIAEHEECEDRDGWVAYMCSMKALRVADKAMATPFTHTALHELIEKVERLTLERHCTELERLDYWCSSRAIRALPTGQIKLEELL